jgi:hypothetical protein
MAKRALAKPAAASAGTRKSTGAQPAMSAELIGDAAGQIWRSLSENGDQTLAALKKSVSASGDLVVAAIGWLAREDKVHFVVSGRTLKISLD